MDDVIKIEKPPAVSAVRGFSKCSFITNDDHGKFNLRSKIRSEIT